MFGVFSYDFYHIRDDHKMSSRVHLIFFFLQLIQLFPCGEFVGGAPGGLFCSAKKTLPSLEMCLNFILQKLFFISGDLGGGHRTHGRIVLITDTRCAGVRSQKIEKRNV